MRSNSLEIKIAGCSSTCRPQLLLLLLFAGIFFKNFYNPVLQARFWGFWELGGGGDVPRLRVTSQLSLTQKATNTGFVLNSIFWKKNLLPYCT